MILKRSPGVRWFVVGALVVVGGCNLDSTVRQDVCDETTFVATCDGQQLSVCVDGSVSRQTCDAGTVCDATNETCGSCGDGITNLVEGCDDGNELDGDGCSATCAVEFCGDDVVQPDEECDDGNTVSGDDCSAACLAEPIQLVAGGDAFVNSGHTCALFANGTVRCWGRNNVGQLGYGNTLDLGDQPGEMPPPIVDVGGFVVKLAAGAEHTCALLDSGNVRCWGRNNVGQLGYGNTNIIGDNETPASAGDVNVGATVVEIASGFEHTCAVLSTGNVRCWGRNNVGQLGYGNTTIIGDDEAPALAGNVNVGGTVVQVTTNFQHTCALLSSGNVRCWGSAANGRLGYVNNNDIGDNEDPATAGDVNLGGTVVQITSGFAHNCALLNTGDVRCWGFGAEGRLGYGNLNSIGDTETPASAGSVNITGGVGSVEEVRAGAGFNCALLNTGDVRCWGRTSVLPTQGQLGYGNTNDFGDDETPASAGNVNIGGTVVQIATGSEHTCVLLADRRVSCWGGNLDGRLGYGNTATIGDNEPPAAVGSFSLIPTGP